MAMASRTERTLLGRMGVNEALHGQRRGEFLLMHALERSWIGSRQVASWAMVVDAKMGARDFYRKHDFVPLPLQPDRLFCPWRRLRRCSLRRIHSPVDGPWGREKTTKDICRDLALPKWEALPERIEPLQPQLPAAVLRNDNKKRASPLDSSA